MVIMCVFLTGLVVVLIRNILHVSAKLWLMLLVVVLLLWVFPLPCIPREVSVLLVMRLCLRLRLQITLAPPARFPPGV